MTRSGARVTSGYLSDFEAVGVGGDPVYRASSQILALIQKELGADLVKMFAIPVRDEKNNIIDWYATQDGPATAFAQVSIDAQKELRKEIEAKFGQVRKLSERLLADSSNETAKKYGGLLRAIQAYPSDSQVFVINGSPVIAFWGFKPNAVGGEGRTQPIPVSPPPPAPIAPVDSIGSNDGEMNVGQASHATPQTQTLRAPATPQAAANLQNNFEPTSSGAGDVVVSKIERTWWQRFGWWLFLLSLLIFGIPAILRSCSSDFPLYDATKHNQDCSPAQTTRCESTSTDQVRSPDSPAISPPVTESPKLAPQVSEQAPLAPPVLKAKDLKAFKGNWSLITSLFNANTKEKLQVDFAFDENGVAQIQVRELNGNLCYGTGTAEITSESSFNVDMSSLQCKNGTTYRPNKASCKVADNFRQAECELICVKGACSATFQRTETKSPK